MNYGQENVQYLPIPSASASLAKLILDRNIGS